jgi:hypothetical protein
MRFRLFRSLYADHITLFDLQAGEILGRAPNEGTVFSDA